MERLPAVRLLCPSTAPASPQPATLGIGWIAAQLEAAAWPERSRAIGDILGVS